MEWISIEDREPESKTHILGYGQIDGEIYGIADPVEMTRGAGYYIGGRRMEMDGDAYYVYLCNITHWMPLPPPPST